MVLRSSQGPSSRCQGQFTFFFKLRRNKLECLFFKVLVRLVRSSLKCPVARVGPCLTQQMLDYPGKNLLGTNTLAYSDAASGDGERCFITVGGGGPGGPMFKTFFFVTKYFSCECFCSCILSHKSNICGLRLDPI